MRLTNIDYEQIGRGVVALFMFGVPLFSALGIFGWIESKLKQKKSKQNKPKQPKEDDFFFESVKDWKTMK